VKRLASRVAVLLAGILPIVGLSVMFTQPAAAAENYANAVCNSDYSYNSIRVYSNYPGATYSYTLGAGQCVSRPWNGADNLRVDVEGCSNIIQCWDIDSYKIGEINVGWGPCHEDSENDASDPPDSYNDNGIRYRNYRTTTCQV
jgi:hypothetical protein